ncbi:hypothetical protein [Rhizobium leguminosarum]|uniref:Uncharacterized protein n=1 Tax=Rhizobium leguminosarum TaxID=384 RepID=A0A4Q8Y211_RHILE|nr:hypothetical protein [Rhizobium leguminosarum]QIO50383.1 hypothetical protein HA461_03970 [Rhizobium leguminosarum bv. trifolii]TAU85143.1 hypothetical protein ELI40_18675 [Rhizobium leguminosarum]TAX11289.1 hypothetical protein ELI07_18190 [Rhizobium leguminosarum]TAX73472.1 hypothetical protein ELI03_17795 [Rhizobium leguminosarum]TAY12214.1 hypothetical protein ELH96_10820 [Rhizobium leguminosarum]
MKPPSPATTRQSHMRLKWLLLLLALVLGLWFYAAMILLREVWTCGAQIYGPRLPVLDGLIGCVSANELGDILAGFFAPAAFIVLIFALWAQGLELQAQREELVKTRGEFEQSREVAKAQLDLIEMQNAIAMRTARANYELSLFDRRMDVYISVRQTLLGTNLQNAAGSIYAALIKAKPLFVPAAIQWLEGILADIHAYQGFWNTDNSLQREQITDAEHKRQQEAQKQMMELETKFQMAALQGPLDEHLGVSLTMPEALFPPMVDDAEDRLDVEADREAMARIKDGTEEVIPAGELPAT